MSLGSMITKARKDAGLSIDDLSAATNIRVPLLRQMESDNFTQCGGETYARGHIRNIATKLNIDPQLFITAFEDEQMHVDRSMQDLLVENSGMLEPGQAHKVSWKVLVTISISTLFIAGLTQIIVTNNSGTDIPVALEETAEPSASTEPSAESTEKVDSVPSDEATISTGQGVEVVMLTGDNENTAKAVADELGLTSYKAGCLPEDKLNEIKRLQAEGKIVAMAGDGINDAPALAQANIGIAMGTGTDVAIESAKITLVKGDLQGIVKAKNLSHAVMRNIKQNLFFALGYNTLGIPVAAGVLYPFFGILLSPMIAALAMSFSSVSVIINALRLRRLNL